MGVKIATEVMIPLVCETEATGLAYQNNRFGPKTMLKHGHSGWKGSIVL